jgi:hypothetical protein
MSTTTWARHEKALPASEIPPARAGAMNSFRVPAPIAEAEAPDMSPFALKIVVLTLALGALFLAALGAWVWYAAHLYQNIG